MNINNNVINNQATIIVGMIGSVSNGKSSIIKMISGSATQRHKDEQQTNRTIRVGYSNAKIFKCNECEEPLCYQSTSSSVTNYKCKYCNNNTILTKHISFTDIPGHNLFMATMLNGTCAMDCAILVESCANEVIPSVQTMEHYKIIKKLNIPIMFICLNKADLMISKPTELKNIMANLKQQFNVPVIPVSGTLNYNIDVVCQYLSMLNISHNNSECNPKMFTIRSFNVNKPGTKILNLIGGVVGGCLEKGILSTNDNVMLCPGYIEKNKDTTKSNIWNYIPLNCKVLSIDSEKNNLDYAVPGGLIGVQLDIDPAITGGDRIVGHVLFKQCDANNYKVYETIQIKYEKINDYEVNVNDVLHLNINANNVKSNVLQILQTHMELKLEKPVCVEHNNKITMSIKTTQNITNIFAGGNVIGGNESLMI